MSICLLLFVCTCIHAQTKKRALFLGNSYTASFNLPQLISFVAHSMNDTLEYDMNVPGGYTLQGHSTNTLSINKIKAGNWDFVSLQEQSQLPSFPLSEVQAFVFPYARYLDSMINTYNPCAETVFFMTWGRRDGDASNCSFMPDVCTYEGMDSLLYNRYMTMTIDNNAIVSPVGAVWKYIRTHYPDIELYQGDGSHPSEKGSYAAACSFYTVMFRKDPTNITYDHTLPATDAQRIKTAVKAVVFDSLLQWQVGKFDLKADFTYTNDDSLNVNFTNTSMNAIGSTWNLGDGTTSDEMNPVHHYAAPGNYMVTVFSHNHCGELSTKSSPVIVKPIPVKNDVGFVYPNPVKDVFYVELNTALLENVRIVNMLAQKMNVDIVKGNNNVLVDTHTLPSGVYYISLVYNGKMITRKFLKL